MSGAIVAVAARRVVVRIALDARTRQGTTLYRACLPHIQAYRLSGDERTPQALWERRPPVAEPWPEAMAVSSVFLFVSRPPSGFPRDRESRVIPGRRSMPAGGGGLRRSDSDAAMLAYCTSETGSPEEQEGSCGIGVTAGGGPDGWTARVGRDCRRGGPPGGGADCAGCSAATLPVGPAPPRRRPQARSVSHGGIEDGVPRIASGSGYDGVARERPPGRAMQRRRGAGAGEGSLVGGSSRMAGCAARMGARTGPWPARRCGTGTPAACGWCGCRPPGGRRGLRSPGRSGPAATSRPDSSAGAGPARPGR